MNVVPLRRFNNEHTNDELPDVGPLQVLRGLMQDGDADAALDALVQQEQPAARQLVRVLHHLRPERQGLVHML